jgi:hypothetical protein
MQRACGMGQRVRRVEWWNGIKVEGWDMVEGWDGKCGIPSSAHQLVSSSSRQQLQNNLYIIGEKM